MSPNALLDQGLAAHGRGDIAAAAAIYREILKVEPRNAVALQMLGTAELQRGNPSEAVSLIGQAVALMPGLAEAHSNLGVALRALEHWGEAEASYRRAIALRPTYAEAHNNLGRLLRDRGRLDEAGESLERATSLAPERPNYLLNLGIVRRRQGRLEEAGRHLQAALALNGEHAETWNELGVVLLDLRQLEGAAAAFRRAAALRPGYAEAQVNLGATLRQLGRLDEAGAAYEEALRLAPGRADAHTNLGVLRITQGRLVEAEIAYNAALETSPTSAEAQANFGVLRMAQGRVDEAIACYDAVIAEHPDNANALWSRATALLLKGDFERGWAAYEHRWDTKQARRRDFAQPTWEGEPIGDKVLLVHAEQGLGDTIHFARFLPSLAGRAQRILFEVQAELAELLRGTPGADLVIARGETLPPFDVHVPLLSLARILGTRLETIPASVPYLHVDPTLETKWRDRLGAAHGLRVGLVWAGNPKHINDANRSAPRSFVASIVRPPDCAFFALQLGQRRADLDDPGLANVVDLAPDLASFMDTAAALRQMDLCIAVDTSVAHLAGALAVPTWVLLPTLPDWRWLLGRSDSPWYPTMRLFRQRQPGDWAGLAEEVGAQLAGLAQRQSALRAA